jgi:hypothetical protein
MSKTINVQHCKIIDLFLNCQNICRSIGQNAPFVVKIRFLWPKKSIFAPVYNKNIANKYGKRDQKSTTLAGRPNEDRMGKTSYAPSERTRG